MPGLDDSHNAAASLELRPQIFMQQTLIKKNLLSSYILKPSVRGSNISESLHRDREVVPKIFPTELLRSIHGVQCLFGVRCLLQFPKIGNAPQIRCSAPKDAWKSRLNAPPNRVDFHLASSISVIETHSSGLRYPLTRNNDLSLRQPVRFLNFAK